MIRSWRRSETASRHWSRTPRSSSMAAYPVPIVSEASLSPIRFLVRSSVVWESRPAVAFDGQRSTYGELYRDVCRTAGALRDLGVRAGDRVAVLLPNVPAMLRL